jgi:NitT/TauT family transport system substrate-binding protein
MKRWEFTFRLRGRSVRYVGAATRALEGVGLRNSRGEPMTHIWRLSYIIAAAVAVVAMTPKAPAQDSMKVAVDQRGAWETAAPELGQRAGIFKKHGITLDLTYPRAESEIETAVISGSAVVGMGVGILEVLRAYATKEAPIRIIGAIMTGSANYWYVAASSPIKTVTDISGRTIAYSKADASSQYDVFDLMQRYRVKRPVLIAGATATFDQVMSGKSASGRRPDTAQVPYRLWSSS